MLTFLDFLTTDKYFAAKSYISGSISGIGADLDSPTSTLTFSENHQQPQAAIIQNYGIGSENSIPMIELVGTASGCSSETGIIKEEGEINDWKNLANSNLTQNNSAYHDHLGISMENPWTPESLRLNIGSAMEEGFTNLLLSDSGDRSLTESGKESDISGSGSGSDYYEDNKNYWNSILNLVNSSPSDSPMF